jgi:hypothetical protein
MGLRAPMKRTARSCGDGGRSGSTSYRRRRGRSAQQQQQQQQQQQPSSNGGSAGLDSAPWVGQIKMCQRPWHLEMRRAGRSPLEGVACRPCGRRIAVEGEHERRSVRGVRCRARAMGIRGGFRSRGLEDGGTEGLRDASSTRRRWQVEASGRRPSERAGGQHRRRHHDDGTGARCDCCRRKAQARTSTLSREAVAAEWERPSSSIGCSSTFRAGSQRLWARVCGGGRCRCSVGGAGEGGGQCAVCGVRCAVCVCV